MNCCSCHSSSCIRQVPLFERLSDQEILLIEGITHSSVYEKGSYVFEEGEPSEALYVLHTGLIKLTQTSRDGKEHILRFLFPGDYFGQFALLQNKQNYASAKVMESGTVCRMHRRDFIPLLQQYASLSYSFLLSMSEQLASAEEWQGALHMLEVDKRLAKMLLYYYRKDTVHAVSHQERKLVLPAAKKEVAAMIGTTAETFSRKLNQFEKKKLITVHQRNIYITDLKALETMAEMRI